MTDSTRLENLRRIATKSKKPLPWYGLAMELRSNGLFDEALATFDRVHEIDGTYVPAWFMHAQLLAERGQTDSARTTLVKGIAVAHSVGDSHAAGEMQSLLDSLDD